MNNIKFSIFGKVVIINRFNEFGNRRLMPVFQCSMSRAVQKHRRDLPHLNDLVTSPGHYEHYGLKCNSNGKNPCPPVKIRENLSIFQRAPCVSSQAVILTKFRLTRSLENISSINYATSKRNGENSARLEYFGAWIKLSFRPCVQLPYLLGVCERCRLSTCSLA